MPEPLSPDVAELLRSNSTAALAAAVVIAGAHPNIAIWAAKLAAATPLARPRGQPRRRNGHGERGPAARRRDRDLADEALLEAMRAAPSETIGEWAREIHRSRTSVVSGLMRLKDAGLVERSPWRVVEAKESERPTEPWTTSAQLVVRERAKMRAHA